MQRLRTILFSVGLTLVCGVYGGWGVLQRVQFSAPVSVLPGEARSVERSPHVTQPHLAHRESGRRALLAGGHGGRPAASKIARELMARRGSGAASEKKKREPATSSPPFISRG